MNEYMYNRFKYLTEYTDEELVKELDEAQDDLDYMNEQLDDPSVRSNQKTEYEETDIPHREDQIAFINMLVQQRGIDVDAIRGASFVEEEGLGRSK